MNRGDAPNEWRRTIVQIVVRDNNVEQALRALKKKMQREGLFREMKARQYFEKPSEKRFAALASWLASAPSAKASYRRLSGLPVSIKALPVRAGGAFCFRS